MKLNVLYRSETVSLFLIHKFKYFSQLFRFMARKDDRRMPMGQAGLIRYFSEDGGIRIKPTTVIWMSLGFGTAVLVLKFLA